MEQYGGDGGVITRSQHGFVKSKLCKTNLMSFDTMPGLVDERKVVETIYLIFSKAFDVIPYDVLRSKLKNRELH